MRNEIIQSLNTLHDLKDGDDQRDLLYTLEGELSPGDYSSFLPPQKQHMLQYVFTVIEALKTCLRGLPNVSSVETATTTSLEVYYTPNDYAIIECSIDSRLASLFIYGILQSNIIEQIEQCIINNHLILITEQERHELEEQGLYNELF